MKLKTSVFELCWAKYRNLPEVARAMGISLSQIYRVRHGERPINQKFIIGAMKAFPGYKLDDLFYVQETELTRNRKRHYHTGITVEQVVDLYHQGLLVKDIMQILGCNAKTVRRRLRLAGISKSECYSRNRTLMTIAVGKPE